MAKKQEKLRCCLCGRTEDEVALMMPGLNGCICNECAEQANEIAHQFLQKAHDKKVEEFHLDEMPRRNQKLLGPVCDRAGHGEDIFECGGI